MALLATASPAAAQSASDQGNIIAWYHVCEVSLPLTYGSISAARNLTDDGKTLFENDGVVWTANRNANGFAPDGWYRISWSSPNTSVPKPIAQLGSQVLIQVSIDGKKMPREAMFTLRRPRSADVYALTAGLSVPLLNRTRHYFDFAYFRLNDVLAYATGLDALDFALETLPGKTPFATWTAGRLELAPLREAVDALPQVDALLTAKAANFRTECRREPQYEDPGAEI